MKIFPYAALLYNQIEKADFLYIEFEAPNGISLIMFNSLQKSDKN